MEDKVHADTGIIFESGIANPFTAMTYSGISSYLFEE